MITQPQSTPAEIPADSIDIIKASGQKLCKSDNLYKAYYRYLQSLWRVRMNLPVKKPEGLRDEDVYGNYIAVDKGNFMTDAIHNLAEYEMSNKGDRLINENRMRHNLLSSQPLCFNLFGELKMNTDKALQFFNILYDNYFSSIDNIEFEYNPARSDPRLTGDRSAFDVFVEYTSTEDKSGFIGIEVKYSETLFEGKDEVKRTLEKQYCGENRTRRDRYIELSEGLFKPNSIIELVTLPYFQIWRDHLLAVSMLKAFPDKYDEGLFMFLAPYGNKLCRDGVNRYIELLQKREGLDSNFCHAWLEDYISTLDAVYNEDWTKNMKQRYLGLEQ